VLIATLIDGCRVHSRREVVRGSRDYMLRDHYGQYRERKTLVVAFD
jgi:hypothetical protein